MKPRPDDPQCWCDDCAWIQYHRSQGRLSRRLTLAEELHNLNMVLTAMGHEILRATRLDKAIKWLEVRL